MLVEGREMLFEEKHLSPLHTSPLSAKPFGTANSGRRLLNTPVCRYLFKRSAFEMEDGDF